MEHPQTAPSQDFPQFPGYIPFERLYRSSRVAVYRAIEQATQRQVVIKALERAYPSFNELVQFRNQYAIARNLDFPGIVRPLNLIPWENSYILVFEDTESVSLAHFIQQQPLALPTVLKIALQLVEILTHLQRNCIIHKDLKPANILIHPDSGKVALIDFSISSPLPKEIAQIHNPNVLEGTLAYIAPEQTGRMNRGIDYRSDFYALGVTLFELLTGELPFTSSDPLELVHCHIATKVEFPVDCGVPEALQAVILKLMAKNAEDRYQSTLGLKHDLARCAREWEETGAIAEFELGQQDACDRFILPEKLYGREKEVSQLLAAFERVSGREWGTVNSQQSSGKGDSPRPTADGPRAEMILVAGFSGIGKTAVINEVHKPITRQKGYFIQGKFDQFNRNIPLSAFVQAFRDLMGQLLSESDAQLAQWREKIRAIVGDSGRILTEIIPDLEQIIGPQPEPPELSASGRQNRFNLLFQRFIELFATPERPLTIFLDDLQWADSASLQMLKLLIEGGRSLLLLGAYRDNEVSAVHPFILAVEEFKKAGITVNTIPLAPLTFDDINRLLTDTLHCAAELVRPLAELVEQKTRGNPFFIAQFLKALQENSYINFNRELEYWECDLSKINVSLLADDAVEFMVAQLQKLPEETQQVLKMAACIGDRFDLATLAAICERSESEMAMDLWNALQEGLILPKNETYKFYLNPDCHETQAEQIKEVLYIFLHDRVQQAAYALIPDENKEIIHYKIGQLLMQKIASEERSDRIFELVAQLNRGIAFIGQEAERKELAKLNLMACQKARATTAYRAGWEYAKAGLALLGESAWSENYELSLTLHNLAVEFAALCGDFEALERTAEVAIARARSPLDRVKIYLIKIQTNNAQNRLFEAVALGKEILGQFGLTFPIDPTPEDAQHALERGERLLGGRSLESLIDLPELRDRGKIAILEILKELHYSTLILNYSLHTLTVCVSLEICLQSGNSEISANSYISYGFLLLMRGEVEAGIRWADLAISLLERFNAKKSKPDILLGLCLFFIHRNRPLKETFPLLNESYTYSLEIGDFATAGHSTFLHCLHFLWCGEPLPNFAEQVQNYIKSMREIHQPTSLKNLQLFEQLILNFSGEAKHPNILTGDAEQESEYLQLHQENNYLAALLQLHLYKTMLNYIMGDIEVADRCARAGEAYAEATSGFFSESVFYFYNALAALGNLETGTEEAAIALKRAEENQAKLRAWARYAPMNFQHKVDLIAAEKCRVLGQKAEALEHYDRAIAGAKENEYLQDEALANELAARFYLAWDKPQIAAYYLQKAYYGYARWGAKAKTNQLEQCYPQLLAPILQGQTAMATSGSLGANSLTSGSNPSLWLDLPSVLRAAQTLSEEIHLERLLACLMQLALTNAGAERGHLLLHQEGQWLVVARAEPQGVDLHSRPLEEEPDLPKSFIYAAARRRIPIVCDSLANERTYARDRDVLQRQPQSALVVPLLRQGQLIGLLYLENNLTAGAFTAERQSILQLLASQAAISIDNARLYQQTQNYSQTLEVEVERKTEALNQKARDLESALKQLQQTQAQLIQTEKMSSLGQLVAGIAHEINNPVNFIKGNLDYTQSYVEELIDLLELYRGEYPQASQKIQAKSEEMDLDFVVEDLSKILDSMKAGSDRIDQIVRSLRNFSRLDEAAVKAVDLLSGLDSTLLILGNRLQATPTQPEITIVREYQALPPVTCYPSQLNQVFLNLINNAIDAIRENPQASPNPYLRLQTESLEGERVCIRIANSDSYIPEAIRQKIFEPFFTTKPVGCGTGLGLFVSYSIIEQHQGTLSVRSSVGAETEFEMILPIDSELLGAN